MAEPNQGFTRRSFLKGSAAAGVASTGLAATAAGVATPPPAFPPGEHEIALRINGEEKKLRVESRTTLLDALRDQLDLTGAKRACDRGACGACTVLVNGLSVNSCLMLALDAVGQEATTVESLSQGDQVHPLVQNFASCDAMQCGFCTPGMVMSGLYCLRKRGAPSQAELQHDLAGNICRCGTYGRVMEAIDRTAKASGNGGGR